MRAGILWVLVVLFMPQGSSYKHTQSFFAHADTDSVSVSGDSLIGMQTPEGFLQEIRGNVHVMYGTTQITAEQALRNVTRRRTSFMKHAVLIDEGDTLRADSLDYDEELNIGRATGNVRLTDGEVVTSSPFGIHYADEKRIEFPEGLVLKDSTTTLTGDTGLYWTEDEIADLGGNVRMESEGMKLTSDSLMHYRDPAYSIARGSVRYLTVSDRDTTWITGERMEYNAEDSLSIIRGSPLLVYLEQDSLSVDTLIIRAELLRIQDRQDNSRLEASRSVRVWNSSLTALADSMIYDRSDSDSQELIWLYGHPFIWTEQTQLTGDTMKVVMKDGTMDSLFIWGNAFVAQEDSLISRISQVKGRTLVSTIHDDSLRIFRVGPNAEAIYFRTDEDGVADGALEASGDEVHMQFAGDSLRKITFSTDVQGTRYPENALPAGLALDGLQWEPARKPSRMQLLGDFLAWIREWEF